MDDWICACLCVCDVPVDRQGAICGDCQDGEHFLDRALCRFDPDAEAKFRRENPRDE